MNPKSQDLELRTSQSPRIETHAPYPGIITSRKRPIGIAALRQHSGRQVPEHTSVSLTLLQYGGIRISVDKSIRYASIPIGCMTTSQRRSVERLGATMLERDRRGRGAGQSYVSLQDQQQVMSASEVLGRLMLRLIAYEVRTLVCNSRDCEPVAMQIRVGSRERSQYLACLYHQARVRK